MQTIERRTEPGHFEVILYFEGNSWLFSTFADGSLMQEALDQAEKEFSLHSLHHELGNIRFKATSAYLIHDRYDHYFTKCDGQWQLAQSPPRELPAPCRRNVPQSLRETEAVGANGQSYHGVTSCQSC